MGDKLTGKAAEIRNEYMRKWRAENKDKVREINQRYWMKKAQKQEADNAGQDNQP